MSDSNRDVGTEWTDIPYFSAAPLVNRELPGNYVPSVPTSQCDQKEAERLARIERLLGDVPRIKTAARMFDEQAEREAVEKGGGSVLEKDRFC